MSFFAPKYDMATFHQPVAGLLGAIWTARAEGLGTSSAAITRQCSAVIVYVIAVMPDLGEAAD